VYPAIAARFTTYNNALALDRQCGNPNQVWPRMWILSEMLIRVSKEKRRTTRRYINPFNGVAFMGKEKPAKWPTFVVAAMAGAAPAALTLLRRA